MKKIGLIFILIFSSMNDVFANPYNPLSVSGFNVDLIYDASKENINVNSSIDAKDRSGWFYYTQETNTSGCIPGSITTKAGVAYQLAVSTKNNALQLGDNGTTSGILTLDTPVQTAELWILGLSANGAKDVLVQVNYTDGTSSESSTISFPDWYQSDGKRVPAYGFGRVKNNNGTAQFDGRLQFGLYEKAIPADRHKTVMSISFSTTNGTYTSIFAVSAFDKDAVHTDNRTLYLIPNSHLDTQWNWTVESTIKDYLPKTLNNNFSLFDFCSDYKFNFEGAIKYMFAKEYYPELYQRLKSEIASGRWHVSGGAIDANDVMVPSAESLIRNFLYGQTFYKKEFGIKGGKDIMLPDCFGFPYSLPTIAKHCGMTGFHTAKLRWGSAYNLDNLPKFGLWQGVDGSQIYAVYNPGAYDTENDYKKNNAFNNDILNEIIANNTEIGVPASFKYIGNSGDRGGSLSNETVDWLMKSVNSSGPVTVKIGTPDNFFSSISESQRANMPVWNNELPMETHGVGCYTSHAILKYWNRRNELLADATEKSSVIADWLGGLTYPLETIKNSWIKILWHHFHDDITGTSVPAAYGFTNNDQVLVQLNLSSTMNNAVGAVSSQMNTQVNGIPILVSNPLSIERNEIAEAKINLSTKPAAISVYDSNQNPLPVQIVDYTNGVLHFLFMAKVPSLGYAIYDMRVDDTTSSQIPSTLNITPNTIENENYLLTVDASGDVSSIYDKILKKELVKSPIRLSLSLDQPGYWLSWEISRGDIFRDPYAYVDENVKISIAEKGPLRASLKIERSKNGSNYEQYVRLMAAGSTERIDFDNTVNWQTTDTFLKAEFPLNASNKNATFDLSLGTISRENRTDNLYEVNAHQWVDLTNNSNDYGISILNDCKYGWDKKDNNTLRMTLIHTPKAGSDYSYQTKQDLGLNIFKYSLFRHQGKWNETTQWEASKLNQPLLVYKAEKHTGQLGKSYGFLSLNTSQVSIKAMKKAENSDEIIVRVYELVGENHNGVEMSFPTNIVSAKEVNGVEEYAGEVNYSGNKINFNISKYQPKTFAVKLAPVAEKAEKPSCYPLTIPYNEDVMSSDSKRNDGQFGSTEFTYPAELVPDTIVTDGISFVMGNRADGMPNAIRCSGQTIAVPQNTDSHKLYLLAASANPDGSQIEFSVDGQKTQSVKIENVGNFVGQWGTEYSDRYYRKNNVAFTATHKHNIVQDKDIPYHYMYMYKYLIPVSTTATSITLPDNPDVYIMAMTLSDNKNDDIVPISEVMNLPEQNTEAEENNCGEKLIPSSVSASDYTNDDETPEHAIDGNFTTKWCDSKSASKWIELNFDDEVEICRWTILHAGIESESKITSDFRLQYYNSKGKLTDADIVIGNTENKTDRLPETTFKTKRIRLLVQKGEQNATTARIYEFAVYGTKVSSGIQNILETNHKLTVYNTPNPFTTDTKITCELPENTNSILLEVFDVSGRIIDRNRMDVDKDGYKYEYRWNNNKGLTGIYYYSVSAYGANKSLIARGNGKMLITK